MSRSARTVTRAAAAASSAMVLAGCTTLVAGSALRDPGYQQTVQPGSSTAVQCEKVSAPLTAVDARGAGEPLLRVPQPPGWDRVTQVDSELIRYVLRNPVLATDGFTPTAVITLESNPDATDADSVLIGEDEGLKRIGATDVAAAPATHCGYPARTATFTLPASGPLPPRRASALTVAARFGDTMYAASVTVQSVDPDNATYAGDVRTILTGFEMLPPGLQ